jgi:hypothetical protein
MLFTRLLYDYHTTRMTCQKKLTIDFSFYKAIAYPNVDFYYHITQSYDSLLNTITLYFLYNIT